MRAKLDAEQLEQLAVIAADDATLAALAQLVFKLAIMNGDRSQKRRVAEIELSIT